MKLDARVPDGPVEKKWEKARFDMKLVNPANKRKYKIIVVGSGLAGGGAAATLAELGYGTDEIAEFTRELPADLDTAELLRLALQRSAS